MSKNFTLKGSIALSLGFLVLMSGCSSNEDDSPIQSDPFYQGALLNADLELLNQYWSVFEVNYQKQTAEVPKTYGNCDRDFFTFLDDGAYKEYIIPNSGCIPEEQDLQWSFDRGIITLENSFKDFNEMVIVQLTADKFVFRAKYDIDEDGEEDIFQFLARPYRPNESYFYSNSLEWDDSINNKIRLTWSEYSGINIFDRYEIYLSGENCDISKSVLLATINDSSTTYYEDLDPPVKNQLCYFLKVYTDKGLLFVSYPYSISPEYLDVPSVALEAPLVQNDKISLQWQKYEGLYFSHYEVVLKNYFDSYGSISQERSLIEITDINTTSFTDEAPPLLKNPVYEVRVHNKLGKQNYYNPQVVVSAREAIYLPERVIDLKKIYQFTYSPDETVVFLNGAKKEYYETYIMRFNYGTNKLEAISNSPSYINGNGRNELKVVNSSIGQELMYLKYDGISIYDPQTLQFKYDLKRSDYGPLEDFVYLGNDRYLLLDDTFAYTFSRDFANLTLLDKQAHFTQSQSQFGHRILRIDNDRVLIGDSDKNQSIIFGISAEGMLIAKSTIDIPLTSIWSGESVFNQRDNTIINFRENRIYDLQSTSFSSFEQPYFPLALNTDGTKLMGTSNNPEWNLDAASLHEKKVRTLDLTTSNLEIMETGGYPHSLFENHLGQIVSLSTFFKRPKANYPYERPDFFIEIVAP